MRMRKKKNLIPRLEKCRELIVPDPETRRGAWSGVFANGNPIHIEIGCGKGRFAVEAAKAAPDVNFIALEKERGALVVALELALPEGLPNLKFLSADAERLSEFFAPSEVSRIYINFCDPWKKKKQAKRRLTHEGFLKLYDSLLPPGGEIRFKTDNQPLFEFSVAEIKAFGFTLRNATDDLHGTGLPNIMTEYEQKFSELGFPIHYLEAVKPEFPVSKDIE